MRLPRSSLRSRQRLAIQLAVRTQRHPLQRQPLRRHHVFRQACRQVRGQRFAPVAALALQHHVADQLLAVHRQHRRLAHPRMLQQARLDLAQFDAQAAQLHLVVDPPGVLDHPVGAVARQVAGAVHPLPSHERAGDETLGSQPRTLVVATGQALPGQVQLAEHAHRHRLQVAIEDVAGQVGDRPADRHRVLALLHAGPVGDVDGRLGRAIEVIEAGLRQLGEHLLLGVRRQRLAAANDAFQAGAGDDVFVLQEGLQHRRHEVQRVDPFAVDQRHQLRRVAMVTRRGHHQTCPTHQRPEELPDRHVEAERGLLQHRVADAQAVGLLHPAQAVAQRRMAVAGALGLTGGTGGVDDIGEVLAIEMNIRVRLTVILEPGRTAIQVDPLHTLRQRQLQVRLAEQQLHTAVLQHVGLALLGILRVHRHVGAAGLEDRHQGHDHLDGALHGHAHQAVRTDPALDQGMRQAVGPAVQLGVVQALLAEGQRRRRRRALDLLLEQPVHAALQRVLGRSGVPAFQQLATLLGIEHRQRVDAGLRVLQHAAQQVLPMPRHALDGPRLEQVGRVGQRRPKAVRGFPGIEGKVELCGSTVPGKTLDVQTIDLGILPLAALVVIHHLEQRAVAEIAFGLQGIDQLLERQILVRLRAQRRLAHAAQ